MPRPYIINALDIGSSSIKLLSVAKKPGEEEFEVLGQGQETSSGVRKGVVINVPGTSDIISSLADRVEQNYGQRISTVYSSIGGGHLSCISSHGLVSVSRADQKISNEDVERVLQAAQTFPLSSNKEIIEIFPKEFFVDGEAGIKEAAGMSGVRLEADILAVCGFSPYIKNLSQAILNSGLKVNALVPIPLASARAVLTPREKELGVCLLDIGAGTTSMIVFEEGALLQAAVFPVGSGHITNDLAICLKTDIDTAEKIKLEFGFCGTSFDSGKKSKKAEKIIKIDPASSIESSRVNVSEPLVFTKRALIDIIEARVLEIFSIVNKELKKISRQKLLPAGIVLTGGGAKLPGIKGLVKKEFGLPCRIGVPRIISAFQGDPSLSALCGLILEGVDSEEEERGSWGVVGGIKEKLKRIFKVFIP